GRAVAFPLIQGADACGYIVAVGRDVQPARSGQRVLIDPVLRSRPTARGLETLYLGSDCNGAFAEYMVVPAINAHPMQTSVIDVVGEPGFPALLNVLRRGGRYAVAGAIGGARVALDLRTLYLKDLRLLGCTLTDVSVFANLVRYLEAGEVCPVLAQTYPLPAI